MIVIPDCRESFRLLCNCEERFRSSRNDINIKLCQRQSLIKFLVGSVFVRSCPQNGHIRLADLDLGILGNLDGNGVCAYGLDNPVNAA